MKINALSGFHARTLMSERLLLGLLQVSKTLGQCRMACAGLHISQADLARRANVAPATIVEFEIGRRTPYDRTMRDIPRVLEEAGATFADGGVTLMVEQEK